jgi:hypothetical protein
MGVLDKTIRVTPEEVEGMLKEIEQLPIVSNPYLYSLHTGLVKELNKDREELA